MRCPKCNSSNLGKLGWQLQFHTTIKGNTHVVGKKQKYYCKDCGHKSCNPLMDEVAVDSTK